MQLRGGEELTKEWVQRERRKGGQSLVDEWPLSEQEGKEETMVRSVEEQETRHVCKAKKHLRSGANCIDTRGELKEGEEGSQGLALFFSLQICVTHIT